MSTRPNYPPVHLFCILPPVVHPKPKEPELPEQLRAIIVALKTPNRDSDPAILATEYDLDNEPEYVWEACMASPSQRAAVDAPINFPTTFKDALLAPKSLYRDFWVAQPRTGVLALLSAMQKEVISDTLASMECFCDDTLEGRRCWPHFRKLLFDLAQFGGEDRVPGEHLFKVLRDWVLDNLHPETGRGPLRIFVWDD